MLAACESLGRQINIMEVCGTHTVSIFRNGIRSVLPRNLKLLSGPGCPVCVTDQGYVDTVLQLADREDCLIATYGDMIRVPGKDHSLETKQAKANVNATEAMHGTTSLFAASQEGHVEVVKLLLKAGADWEIIRKIKYVYVPPSNF